MQSDHVIPAADGGGLPAVLTVPDAADGPRPGLVMIYEALGMTAEMRRVARDYAAAGYVVALPDLLARGRPRALCVARALRTSRRGAGRELDDLEATRRWLAARPEVDPDRIGTIGFCLGGSFALLLARTGLYRVSAPFYGGDVRLARSCPVVASYGGRDRSTRGYPQRLVADLAALGVPHDVRTYPDAGHSFMTRTTGLTGRLGPHLPLRAEYHEASAADAHRRVLAFFAEHLDPRP